MDGLAVPVMRRNRPEHMGMKLQIKDSGSWRNVCHFDQVQKIKVMKAGELLLGALAPTRTTLRVVDGDSVIASCYGPDYVWKLVIPSA